MKSTEFNEYLSRQGITVFTIREASRILGKPLHYTTVFLSRNKKIKSAERGLYYTDDAREYEIASNIVFPSYVSLISALRFLNLTEQMPHIIYILSHKRHRNLKSLNGYEVEFKTIKKEFMYGYSKIDGAFVATPEKAVIDMIYLNEFMEYAEEQVELGNINYDTLKKYAERTMNPYVIKKVKEMKKLLPTKSE